MALLLYLLAILQLVWTAVSTDTSAKMRSYTDPCMQAGASHGFSSAHGTNGTINTTETDWLAISPICIVTGWVCSQYFPLDLARHLNNDEPWIQILIAIVQRVGLELARLALIFLVITIELIIKVYQALPALYRLVRGAIVRQLGALHPDIAEILRQYDTLSNSHQANYIRQELRAARSLIYSILKYGAAILAIVTIIRGPPTEKDASAESLEIRDYVVPDWFIRAQPQNRPSYGSSSHYRPADYEQTLPDVQRDERDLWLAVNDISSLLNPVDTASYTESGSVKLSSQATIHDDRISEDSGESNWHTGSVTPELPGREKEPSGLDPLARAASATDSARVRDEKVFYCNTCRQNHCCETLD